jgi:hypothetical protein
MAPRPPPRMDTTPMDSTPRDTSDQLGPHLAGDWKDDDATILDSQIQDHAAPPAAAELPTIPHPAPISGPKPCTRLLTGSLVIPVTWDAPQLVLPADPNRTALQLWASSATATDVARVSDDNGKAQSRGGSALLPVIGQRTSMDGHTGPVWVWCPDAVGPVTVSWLAVTK